MHPSRLDPAGLLDALPHPCLLLDGGLRVVGANRAFLAATGRTLDGLVGGGMADALPAGPEALAAALASAERAAATGRPDAAPALPVTLPTTLPTNLAGREGPAGAEERWWTLDHAPVLDERGAVALVLQHATDVTEAERQRAGAQRARTALEHSEERISALADNLPVAVVYQAETSRDLAERRFTYVSATSERLVGVTAEEALADPAVWLGRVHPEDLPRVLAAEREAARTLATLDLVVRYGRPDGREVVGRVVAKPRAQGDAQGDGRLLWDGLLLDVTEAARAEAALKASEAQVSGVLDGMGEGFVLLDREFRVLRINAAAMAREQQPADAIVGRPVWDAWPGIEDTPLGRLYKRLMRDRASGSVEVRYAWPHREAWFDVRVDPVPEGLAVFSRDITERRRAESRREALARFVDRLRDLEDPAAIAHAAAELLGEALGASRVGYATIDHDAETLHPVRDWAAPGFEPLPPVLRLRDFGTFVDDLKAGALVVVADVRDDARATDPAALEAYGARSIVNVPVVERGRLVALLCVNDARARAWAPGDLALVKDVAERTRTAVERARNAMAQRESEARLSALARASSDVLYRMSPDWGEMRELAGGAFLASTDRPNRSWLLDYIFPEDQPAVVAAIERAIETKGAFELDHRVRRADGTRGWTLSRAVPILDAEGRIVEWFGAASDITARREAEEALRRANETLEAEVDARTAERDRMWDTSPDLMLVIDFQGVFRRVNPAWTAVLGYAPEELVGHQVNEFVLPDDHGETAAAYELAAKGGRPRIENRYRHKDGSTRWISWTAAPAGELTYATGRDVTAEKARDAELRAAEAARRSADALYRAYFENTAEALFVIGVLPDGDFAIEELNPAHEAATGLSTAAMQGRRLAEQLPPEVAGAVAANYARAARSGRPVSYREVLTLAGGERHWDTVLVPVRDGEGRVTRIVGSSRDVTARVQAEEQLRQSQKVEAMGSLMGGVAHDFNNLLTPILGTLDRLQRQGLGSERDQALVAGALQSAERARTLVHRLLAFARRQPLRPAAVDVADLVRGMADLVASTTGPQVALTIEARPGLPAALADANQLELAILNLAVNARDAMPEGGALRIAAAEATVEPGHPSGAAPGPYVRVLIADTGVGMDGATLARAVEPFFSTKGVGRGTGLGLSMVHGLAAQLGGALVLRSRPSRGTEVELWLPVAGPAEAALGEALGEEPDVARPEPAAGAAPEAAGRVLLVDDEAPVRASTADMLADLGYDVVEAASAAEALGLIDGGLAPDLLVTDHLMPGLSGTDLAGLARARRPGLPVLVVSGYAEAQGLAPDLPRLTKPFRQADLAASLAKARRGG